MFYADINNIWEHPTINFVLAITNHKNKSISSNTDSPIFTYKNKKRVALLNDWENSKYFTTSFPIFFSFNIEGHISIIQGLKKERMSLGI